MTPNQDPERLRLEASGKNKVIGWEMTPDEVQAFFQSLGKKVLTFFGYSGIYEDETVVPKIVQDVLPSYSPEIYVVNIGATRGGIGAAYPIAKGMGFTTTGIVSTEALPYLDQISPHIDHICFVKDDQWGGIVLGRGELSPTSQAMVACSDILVGIGGGEISRDEMLAGKKMGKPVHFYPAEINHDWLIERTRKWNLPLPTSFWGAAHEFLADKENKG